MNFKKWTKKTSLTTQVISIVLLMSVVLTVFSTSLEMYSRYTFELENIEKGIEQIDNGISKTAAQGLWEVNEDILNTVLEAIILLPNISYVSVRDNVAKRTIELGKNNTEGARVFKIDLLHEEIGRKSIIGVMSIHIDLVKMINELKSHAWLVLFENLLKAGIIAFFVLILMKKSVTKPVKRLAVWAKELEKDYLSSSLIPDIKLDRNRYINESNELVVLEKSLRSLQGAYALAIGKLKQENSEKEIAKRGMQELNSKLEQMVEEAVEKKNKLQKHVMMQEKLVSLGSVSSGIAHEIKNPLNFINNSSDMVETLSDDLIEVFSKLKKHLSEDDCSELEANLNYLKKASTLIKKHGLRANNIVKSLLVQTISEQSELKETNIKELIITSYKLALGNFQQTRLIRVECNHHFEENLALCYVYPREITQALINVFDNAFYSIYSKKEGSDSSLNYGGIIDIRVFTSGHNLEISIIDNGIGISENDCKKIFDPFWTTRPTGQGTGLGLSMVFEVINIHKGAVDVSSVYGEFTEIKLRINTILNEMIEEVNDTSENKETESSKIAFSENKLKKKVS